MSISRKSVYIGEEALYQSLRASIQKKLSPARFTHSEAVSRLSHTLCLRYDVDPKKGRLAGLAHDIAREFSEAESLAWIKRHRLKAGNWEKAHPVVLHGLIGSDIIRNEWGVRDSEVLRAVADHVLGRPRMSRLAQIIFVADFLEPERGFLEEVERREILALSLPLALLKVTEKIFNFLKAEKIPIAPLTKKMYNYFKYKARE